MLGVSKDSVVSHQKFKSKYEIPFTLLSDPDGEVCERYGVLKEKVRDGKTYMGINRSTFIIDGSGNIARVDRGVDLDGHIRDVLDAR